MANTHGGSFAESVPARAGGLENGLQPSSDRAATMHGDEGRWHPMQGLCPVGRPAATMLGPCRPAQAAEVWQEFAGTACSTRPTGAENALRALPLRCLRVAPPPRRRVVPMAVAPRGLFGHLRRHALPDPVATAQGFVWRYTGRRQSEHFPEAEAGRPPVRKVGGLMGIIAQSVPAKTGGLGIRVKD